MRDYSGLDRALDQLAADVYRDMPQGQHAEISRNVIRLLVEKGIITDGTLTLDVGAGCGIGAVELSKNGAAVTCVDLDPQIESVTKADQSFLPLADAQFELVWARHVLEHSIMPMFTLMEYRRVMREGAHCYVEVPAPDTDAQHELNANHYSILGLNAWGALMGRMFTVIEAWEFKFAVPQPDGTKMNDKYFGFLLKKDMQS